MIKDNDSIDKLSIDNRTSLDPKDWQQTRLIAHKMLDDILDHVENLDKKPLWQEPSPKNKQEFEKSLPLNPTDISQNHSIFMEHILPFNSGNAHSGFMGWVQGGGNIAGMLGEMLAAGMNANLGGRNHIAIKVEQQICDWMAEIFQFPKSAKGLFLTGASQANFVGVLLAKTRAFGVNVRKTGINAASKLIGYATKEVHGCVPRAFEMAGIGSDNLRLIPTNNNHQMNIEMLEAQIAKDVKNGLKPFIIIGTAGTVNAGAIDDLMGISQIAKANDIYFHIDGALGALGIFSNSIKPLLKGIECADSIAFDFHKWGQVPYDAGFLLVKDGDELYKTFAQDNAYLTRANKGLAAGDFWPCDYGPDLSRGFRALKTWFTLRTYGIKALGQSMDNNCLLAKYLEARIIENPILETLANVNLNIVCFRYCGNAGQDLNQINAKIVEELQIAGKAAPSLTIINGNYGIRASITNHRTTKKDIDNLINGIFEVIESINQSAINN